MIRAYIIPLVAGIRPERPQRLRPKYLPFPDQFAWEPMDCGKHALVLVIADVNMATDTTLQAASDVFAFPANLNATIPSGQLANVKTRLEGFNIPGSHLTISSTWRDVVRLVWRAFKFHSVFHGAADPGTEERIFPAGITLDTTYSELPQSARQNLVRVANKLNLDTAALSGASTMRQVMKAVSDQLYPAGIPVMGQIL